MQVFRITKEKWSGNLNGSGIAGRWNPNGIFMCYTAESRALACIEMMVHLQSNLLNHSFKMTAIEIPSGLEIEEIKLNELPPNWSDFLHQNISQEVGKSWVQMGKSCILKVPSVLIKSSYNYLLNPAHIDFGKLKIADIEDFLFDERLAKVI